MSQKSPIILRGVRWALLFLFRQISRVYFRKIEVSNPPDPSIERRLFGANHVNGIIDPMLVMTSTWCRIAPLAKAPLWKIPGLSLLLRAAEAVPVVRRQDEPGKSEGANDELFKTVAKHLSSGKNILIFPEGISHNEPYVVRLKTGAGRMLVGAYEQGLRELTFQAIGLEFDERETFRSRVLVLFGPVRSVDEVMGRAEDPVHAITEQLREDLSDLVVEGETWEEKELVTRVAELIAHDTGDRSMAGRINLCHQVKSAQRALAQYHPLVDKITCLVHRYYEGLAAARLSDRQLVGGQGKDGALALRRLVLLLLLPFAVIGALLFWIPYQIPKLSSRMAKGETDVISTYKLGLGLLVFPAWTVLLMLMALVSLPSPWGGWGVLGVGLLPFAVLPWLDMLDRLEGESSIQLEEIEPPSEQELRHRRAEAMAAIQQAQRMIDT